MPLIKSGDEKCTKMVCTGARDGLDANHTLFFNCGRGFPEDQSSSSAGIRGKSGDGEIFVIEALVV